MLFLNLTSDMTTMCLSVMLIEQKTLIVPEGKPWEAAICNVQVQLNEQEPKQHPPMCNNV